MRWCARTSSWADLMVFPPVFSGLLSIPRLVSSRRGGDRDGGRRGRPSQPVHGPVGGRNFRRRVALEQLGMIVGAQQLLAAVCAGGEGGGGGGGGSAIFAVRRVHLNASGKSARPAKWRAAGGGPNRRASYDLERVFLRSMPALRWGSAARLARLIVIAVLFHLRRTQFQRTTAATLRSATAFSTVRRV